MSKINIIYGKEFDTQRVKKTISDIGWFIKNNYQYKNFSFPKNLDKEKLQSYTEDEIKNAVISEYNDDKYKEFESVIINNWEKVFAELKSAFQKSGLAYQDEYTVYLTKYGTGGSYNLPNIIVINTFSSTKERVLQIIIHEMIHLAIEESIIKHKISQAQKERMVDLFFVKYFPKRVFAQNVYMSLDLEKYDQIFDDNFPDMKAVIEKNEITK